MVVEGPTVQGTFVERFVKEKAVEGPVAENTVDKTEVEDIQQASYSDGSLFSVSVIAIMVLMH